MLSKLANQVYLDVMTAYQEKNANGLNLHSQKFLDLIDDIDELLASDDNFLLGTWLESAKSLAVSNGERRQVSPISCTWYKLKYIVIYYIVIAKYNWFSV